MGGENDEDFWCHFGGFLCVDEIVEIKIGCVELREEWL